MRVSKEIKELAKEIHKAEHLFVEKKISKDHKLDTINCKSREYLECDYFMSKECPETCNFAYRIRHAVPHSSKTGIERFLLKKKHALDEGFDWDAIGIGSKM